MKPVNVRQPARVAARKTATKPSTNLMAHPHEAYFRPLVETASDIISIQNSDGIIRYVSPSVERVLGYTPVEVVARNFMEFVHLDDIASARSAFLHRLQTNGPARQPAEIRCLHRDGSTRVFEVIGNNCLADPIVQGIVINLRDITKSKRAEIALRESEARLRQVTDNMLDVVSQVDMNGVHHYASPSFLKVLGYQPANVLGTTIYEYVHSDDLEYILATIQKAIETRSGARIEARYRHADGHYIWIEAAGSFLFDDNGVPTGAVLAARDVTARRQRESELHAIAAVSASLRAAPSRAEMLPVILDHLLTLVPADGVAFAMRDMTSGGIVIELARGEFARVNGVRLKEGEGVSGQVIATGQPYIIADSRNKSIPSPDLIDEVRAAVCVPLVAHDVTIGALWVGRANALSEAEISLLTAIADIAANALYRAELYQGLQRSNAELMISYDDTLEGWSRALDLRDGLTEGHTQRVVGMTLRLATALGVGNDELANIRRGALLHDVGKIGVPDAILRKPGALTDDEWKIMRLHPVYAYQMLSPIAYLRAALDIPYCHHEHWDGGGYPRGLKGEEIPVAARMFAIVDTWDALRSDRPYRKSLPDDQVRDYIRSKRDILFDAEIVDEFLEMA